MSLVRYFNIFLFKIIIGAIIFSPFFSLAQAPNTQDCMGAIPICNSIYSTILSYSGTGNVHNEITPSYSCLSDGEKNDVWYIFTVQASGNLSFTITPNTSSDDYDWAVYNLTNNSCSDIKTVESIEVSCNWSATTGTTGPNGNGGATATSQGSGGTPFNAVIPVLQGETYVINVSNYSSTQNGYSIDFSASTAVIFDNVPPRLTYVSPSISCGNDVIPFKFSEKILCNTISTSDFAVSGPGGPYTVTNVTGTGCSIGANQEKDFSLNVSPALIPGGNYKLYLLGTAGSVTDLCGNLAPIDSLSFHVNIISSAITSSTDEHCSLSDGTATVTAYGGSNYSYQWSSNPAQVTNTLSNVPQGTYTVTVSSNGCTSTSTITLNNIDLPISTHIASYRDGKCGQNDGEATVAATGGFGQYNYTWSTIPVQTTETATGLGSGPNSVTTYTVTVSTGSCSSSSSVGITVGQNVVAQTAILAQDTCGEGKGKLIASASYGTAPYFFTWSNAQTTDIISHLDGGTYTVTIADAFNCQSTSTSTITSIGKITVNTSVSNENCGKSDGYAIADASGGVFALQYIWSTIPPQNNDTAINLSAGTYNVTVTDGFCTKVGQATLVNISSLVADFIFEPTILDIIESTAHFKDYSKNAIRWLWDFGDGNTSTVREPYHTFDSIGTYAIKLTVEDQDTCKAATTKKLTVNEISTYYIPNAFTPNGDGINDLFQPSTFNINTAYYEFRIFDKWGAEVFSTNNPLEAWDGKVKGTGLITTGVYVYYVSYYDYKDDKRVYKGYVSVMP